MSSSSFSKDNVSLFPLGRASPRGGRDGSALQCFFAIPGREKSSEPIFYMLLRGGSPYMVCKTVMSTFYYLDLHSILAARHFDEITEVIEFSCSRFRCRGLWARSLEHQNRQACGRQFFPTPKQGTIGISRRDIPANGWANVSRSQIEPTKKPAHATPSRPADQRSPSLQF